MVYLSQRDPRWGGKTIGNSKSFVKDYGCTITCIAMASDWFGCYKDPGWMAKNLEFLVDRILWQSIRKVLCFGFEWRFYKYDEYRITDGLNDPNKVCLLNIYNRHWVLALRKLPGGLYLVADPWTGKRAIKSKATISGGAILKK